MSSVKNKIRGGTAFLFLLMILLGGFSLYSLNKTKAQAQAVLKANYESLEFAHDMQQSLQNMPLHKSFADSFEVQLRGQEANITEPGEAEATAALRRDFVRFQSGDPTAYDRLQTDLQNVLRINMRAIRIKNEAAQSGAADAQNFLIALMVMVLIIGFTFALNFPSVVTTPIQKLTDAIRAIANKDYSHRIHLQSKDEFGALAGAFNEMAERLEYFETSNLNKILFEKSRAEAVINSLKDASIGIDKKDTVLFANNQALQLLDLSAKDIVGKNVNEVAGRNDLFRFLLEENTQAPFKIVVDNKENFFTKEVVDVGDAADQSRVIVLKNITSFKELDVAKTNFIATVSHELKTPLASSDFSLKLLEDERTGSLTADQKELIQNLKADNQRMLRILSELLNLSQVEAGRMQLNIAAVDPHRILESSVSAVLSAAKEKNISLRQEVAENLPAVTADADKTSWVLNNFLTNAIKYAPQGSTVIIAAGVQEGGLSVSVSDQGPGIDEAYLPRLFDRYFQVPGRADKKGSGIGLAICKELIEAMDGKIWVKSKYGEGSSFGFVLKTAQNKGENA